MQKGSTTYETTFQSLRNGEILRIQFHNSEGAPEGGSEVTIRTNNMDLAGEVIQHMAGAFSQTVLESTCEFPDEFEEFKHVLDKVDECNSVRLKLTAEIADISQVVKTLVIQAEDARILNAMKQMKKQYSQLYDTNRFFHIFFSIRP